MLTHLFRKQLIRFTLPASWRGKPCRVATSLEDFARTEADSAWQMLQAAQHTTEANLQKAFVENALEELGHADLFAQAAKPLRTHPALTADSPRQRLCTRPDELGSFMAYQFVGEHEIHAEFECYAQACPIPSVRHIFATIEADEDCHQHDAQTRLQHWFADARSAQRAMQKAAWQRDLESFTRLGHRIGRLMSALILLPLFTLSGALFRHACRQRMASSDWYDQNTQLRHLRELP